MAHVKTHSASHPTPKLKDASVPVQHKAKMVLETRLRHRCVLQFEEVDEFSAADASKHQPNDCTK